MRDIVENVASNKGVSTFEVIEI